MSNSNYTITIPLIDYEKLKLIEQGLSERKAIGFSVGYGAISVFYLPDDDHINRSLSTEINRLREVVASYENKSKKSKWWFK